MKLRIQIVLPLLISLALVSGCTTSRKPLPGPLEKPEPVAADITSDLSLQIGRLEKELEGQKELELEYLKRQSASLWFIVASNDFGDMRFNKTNLLHNLTQAINEGNPAVLKKLNGVVSYFLAKSWVMVKKEKEPAETMFLHPQRYYKELIHHSPKLELKKIHFSALQMMMLYWPEENLHAQATLFKLLTQPQSSKLFLRWGEKLTPDQRNDFIFVYNALEFFVFPSSERFRELAQYPKFNDLFYKSLLQPSASFAATLQGMHKAGIDFTPYAPLLRNFNQRRGIFNHYARLYIQEELKRGNREKA
jgi:hypothetical protein